MNNDASVSTSTVNAKDVKSDLQDHEQYEVDPPEAASLVSLRSADQSRRATIMRSVSQEFVFEQGENGNYPRSPTREGFLMSDNAIRTEAVRICKSSSREPRLLSECNRIDLGQAENRSSAHPAGLQSTPNLMQITHKRLNVCDKCHQKRLDSSRDTRNWKMPRQRGKMFNSVRAFVACLSLLQLVQVMGSGYGKSALTSIERRYKLSTFRVGMLQSCFHFGNLAVILFVSYYGSKWNRPRAIAIGSLVMAASSLLSAMPQFVGSRYHVEQSGNVMDTVAGISSGLNTEDVSNGILNSTHQSSPFAGIRISSSRMRFKSGSGPNFPLSRLSAETKLCALDVVPGLERAPHTPESKAIFDVSEPVYSEYSAQKVSGVRDSENAKDEKHWDDSHLYLFIAFGSVLKGMGHSPLHPLGMSFVDDFATPRNSAIYIGVVSALSLLGPAFGFILGSQTAGMWVDWGWVDTSKVPIDPQHPLWVGAWWCGYVVTAFLLLLATIPFCMFPREMPEEQEGEASAIYCFGCLTRGRCNDRARWNTSLHQSQTESFNRGADVVAQMPDLCSCNAAPATRDARLQNSHIRSFSAQRCPKEQKSILESRHQITNDVDEVNTVNPKTYHEVPSQFKARVFTDSTSRDMHLQSPRRQSLTSPMKFAIGKFASELEDERKFDARRVTNSRRPSRLEKLALSDFSASMKGLLTDVVFLSITLAFVFLTSFLAASVSYASKYMETQFSVSASFANLLNGSVNLPMAVVGNLLGGWLIQRFDLNVRRTMAVVVAGISMTVVCVAILIFLKCNLGPDLSYSIGSDGGKCSAPCHCGDAFEPVCDATTNLTYRSPCHAGCADVASQQKSDQVFRGCRCTIGAQPSNESESGQPVAAKWNDGGGVLLRGRCHHPDCSKSHMPLFLAVMGTASLTAGLASTPSSLLVLRIVPPAEKAFAVGIVFVFTRVLAWIPAPVYVGHVIDSTCLRWSNVGRAEYRDDAAQATQSGRNHCEVYNKDRLRRHFFAVTGGQLVLSLLFYVLALYLDARRPKAQRRERPQIRRFESLPISNKTLGRTTTASLLRRENFSSTSEVRRNEDSTYGSAASEDDEYATKTAFKASIMVTIPMPASAMMSETCEPSMSPCQGSVCTNKDDGVTSL